MAKKKNVEPVAAVEPNVKRFRVALDCPTPLAFRWAVVEADDSEQAKQKFLDPNGISDSVHPFEINEMRD